MDELIDYMMGGGDVATEVSLEGFNSALNNWEEFTNKLKEQLTKIRDDKAAEEQAERDEAKADYDE